MSEPRRTGRKPALGTQRAEHATHARERRVAEAVRTQLSSALLRDLADPRLSSIVITAVDVTVDLSLARVQVRLLGEDDAARRASALRALERVKSRLRRGLGPVLGLRRVPDLSFSYDVGPDAAERVARILEEIERERGE